MYEYVFFHRQLAEELLHKAQQMDPTAKLVEQPPAWEVHVSEAISDAEENLLSACYDRLFDQDRDLYENEHSQDQPGYHAASVQLLLGNGTTVYAQVNPVIMDKITNALSQKELTEFLGDIVFATENPDERSICQRHRER